MSVIQQTKEELQDVSILLNIASALLEISSTKIKSLRDDYETNKTFYAEVSELYRMVKLAAKKQNFALQKTKKAGKEIRVAITSNKRFYGSLNRTVMNAFEEGMAKESSAAHLVVGHTGKHYMENSDHAKGCSYLSFQDDYPTPTETNVFLERVRPFDRVTLFYPRFVNIFRQEPEAVDITYSTDVDDTDVADSVVEQIYEPELPHILVFFETQIRRLLFTRIMLESELSRTAARIVKMHSTEDRAEAAISEKQILLRKETMFVEDLRLLETFSSALQWKKQ